MESFTQRDLLVIILAVIMGTAARLATLKADMRQVPSVPNGYFIHLVNGFIAAGLGAVAIPALLSRDFAAFTFLLLAVQHFREIRKQEKECLDALEHTEYTPRGDAYIDGIAKTFEVRNYIALLTSFGTVLILRLTEPESLELMTALAFVSGTVIALIMIRLTKGRHIGDICHVYEANIEMDGAALYADGIYVSRAIGTEAAQKLFLNEGVAFIVKPKAQKHRLTIENEGQTRAMLFDAVRAFGVKQYQFTRRSLPDGRLVIAFVPINPDREGIAAAIRKTPVLESVRKRSKGVK